MTHPVAILLPIKQIGELKPDDYVGLIDRNAVECLKVRLQAEGLRTPIWVRKNGNAWKGAPYSVIAGRHRLIAATELGWSEIAAEVRADASSKAEDLRRLQLAENLDRRELRPIERACFIMDRWRDAAALVPKSVPKSQQAEAIRQRWSVSDTVSDTEEIDAATAAAIGVKSTKTVQRYRKIYEKIVAELPDLFAALNAHPLGEHRETAKKLALVRDVDQRRKAAELMLERVDWESISAVLVAAGISGDTGNRPAKTTAAGIDLWNKFSREKQRAHAEWIAHKVDATTANKMLNTFKIRGLLP